MPTTLDEIYRVLANHSVSSKDRKWIKENVGSKQLQVLSSNPKDFVIPSHDKRYLEFFLSVAQYIVQHGEVISKEDFNPKRSGLIIIRPGVIHLYTAINAHLQDNV